MTDEELSRILTARVRAVPGVVDLYPPKSLVQTAVDVVAATLSLRAPDVLVQVDRREDVVRVSTGIAVHDDRPAPDTIREVGDVVRAGVAEETGTDADLVSVTIRLVEGLGVPSAAVPDDELDELADDGQRGDAVVA